MKKLSVLAALLTLSIMGNIFLVFDYFENAERFDAFIDKAVSEESEVIRLMYSNDFDGALKKLLDAYSYKSLYVEFCIKSKKEDMCSESKKIFNPK
ncbi:MAG TPA: hypothetical protein PK002_04915 [Cellvibrio sp.]|nr:hypothetical protein [Cellvibrio sp.]